MPAEPHRLDIPQEPATKEAPPQSPFGTVPNSRPLFDGSTIPPPVFLPAGPLVEIEGFEILEELGRGGMGVVYKARQKGLNRLVALKMIRDALLAGPDEISRFLLEAQAVAQLHHPHIVQIHHIGEYAGRPYFVLEYLDGNSLRHKIAGQPQPARGSAVLVEILARAVQAAHAQGIVHRDLKPANVLLAADGTPKVADFGLAKRLQVKDGLTPHTAVMGSPSYMAPEQARGQSRDIGPAADVYALGAILYELLTGRPPFLAETPAATVLLVLQQEPVSPRQLQPHVPVELETISLKCLRKEPGQRYASAADLADDLRRFLDGVPIKAVPASLWEKGCKWVRRYPVVTGLLAVVVLVAALGASLVLWKWGEAVRERDRAEAARKQEEQRAIEAIQARKDAEQARGEAEDARQKEADQRARAEAERNRAERRLCFNHISQAYRAWRENQVGLARRLLKQCPAKLQDWEYRYLQRLCAGGQRTLHGHQGPVHAVAFSPDGRQVASGGADGTVRVWDSRIGQELLTLTGHDTVTSVAFSPDGKRLASGGDARENEGGEVRVWDLAVGKAEVVFKPDSIQVLAVAFSPDGRLIACGGRDGVVKVCKADSGEVVQTLKGHRFPITCLAFAPAADRKDKKEGKTPLLLASGDGDPASAHPEYAGGGPGEVKLWDLATGKAVRTFKGHTKAVHALAFRPDGKELASGGFDQLIKLWDCATGAEVATLAGHSHPLFGLSYSADSRLLASASGNEYDPNQPGELKVWDLGTRKEAYTLHGHTEDVTAVAFLPGSAGEEVLDAYSLVSASRDGTVMVWDAGRPQEALSLRGHSRGLVGVAFSPDSRWVATTACDRLVKVWDAVTGEIRWTLKGHRNKVNSVSFAPDGQTLASGASDGTIRIWDLATGSEARVIEQGNDVTAVAFQPAGDKSGQGPPLLASAGWDRTVHVWDPTTGKEMTALRGHSYFVLTLAFSPDGKHIAAGSGNPVAGFDIANDKEGQQPGEVKVWDWRKEQVVQTFTGHRQAVLSVAFSPDGKQVVSVGGDTFRPKQPGEIKVWEAATGKEVMDLTGGHTSVVWGVAWSPNGTRIATASADYKIKLWDAGSGEEALTLTGHRHEVIAVAFSPDGQRLASTSADNTGRLWDDGLVGK